MTTDQGRHWHLRAFVQVAPQPGESPRSPGVRISCALTAEELLIAESVLRDLGQWVERVGPMTGQPCPGCSWYAEQLPAPLHVIAPADVDPHKTFAAPYYLEAVGSGYRVRERESGAVVGGWFMDKKRAEEYRDWLIKKRAERLKREREESRGRATDQASGKDETGA